MQMIQESKCFLGGTPWFAVALAVGISFLGCGSTEEGSRSLPDKQSLPLSVRAEIDGRSQLRIQGSRVSWRHFEWEAPGMWGDDQPTFLNGAEWWPFWEEDENAFCNCDSRADELLSVPLKSDGTAIQLQVVSGRGSVTIVEQPTAANQFTAAIEFNDTLPDRAWYEVRITQN